MTNILILGDSYVSKIFIPANSQLFYIGRKREWHSLEIVEYIIDFPIIFDVEEYDKKYNEIIFLCNSIEGKYGKIDFIIGNSEHTLTLASKLRQQLKVLGRTLDEIIPFRNKSIMRDRINSAGILGQVEYYSPLLSNNTLNIDSGNSYPLVVKPCSQAGSRFVSFVNNKNELLMATNDLVNHQINYIIEKKIDGEIIHIDGVYRNGELKFICANKYIYDCISWINKNTPMSSIQITGKKIEYDIVNFTNKVLKSIGTKDVVFHLEAFIQSSGDIQLLEIAARPGGAAITPAIKEFYGIDLQEESLKIDLNIETTINSSGYLSCDRSYIDTFSWIVFPIKEKRKIMIEEIIGLANLPKSVKWSLVVKTGDVYNDMFWEDQALAKFVLLGSHDNLLHDMSHLEQYIDVKFKVI
ncbi:hypothetical protein B9T11_10100 [Wohlfahrtiimonas chitiniclastica]|uniref:ATP-grasp domain-containing protein n=1 Tax=Wohlfahrtiimonas chitiniclastica TaxID=400946 RepID=UPI000B992A56|nr:ATP-grasp domain-containing protein [Wohlfahrtiimonas chitiniclastica]OYQ77501.1 hypothetical protein B9T11_10100 [Wohlfahrtiimonas chitiniclastica]